MDMPDIPPIAQLPEWESAQIQRSQLARPAAQGRIRLPKWSVKYSMTSFVDRAFLPHRKYHDHSLQKCIVLTSLLVVIILALIVGLAVGLSKRSRSEPLPLPSNTQNFTGDLTYYEPGLGACGVTSSSMDDIFSVSHIVFDTKSRSSDPNANPLCGLKIRATRFDEQFNAQRSIDLTLVDRCVGCKAADIDVSPGAFDKLAAAALGRVSVTWAWLSPTPKP